LMKDGNGMVMATMATMATTTTTAAAATTPTKTTDDDCFRRWQSSTVTDAPSYTLYQYRICPFSNIAKVYLKSNGIFFDEVEVNPFTKAELDFSKDGYKKVPMLTISSNDGKGDEQQLNGSEAIVAHFEALTDKNGSNNKKDDKNEDDGNWEMYARNTLAPLLYPNLCESFQASFNAFNYVHSTPNNFSQLQKYLIQYVGSVAMYLAASKIKKKHGIDDARKALDDELTVLEQKLQQQEFLDINSSPQDSGGLGLGDLAVFGVLKGLEGLPISTEIIEDDRYSHLGRWYRKIDEIVQ
jgi:glutathione S-transferase